MSTFPPSADSFEGAHNPEALLRSAEMAAMRVLVIEDDADTCENLCDILELDGYEVETATSMAQVLCRRDLAGFGAMVLDRRLPDGTADELLPFLKQQAPEASIIVVTGHADLDGAIAAIRNGAADYTLKPVNADSLRARLAALAETRRLAVEKERAESAFQTLVEAAPCLIAIGRSSGQLLYVNPFAIKTMGFTPAEILEPSGAGQLHDRILSIRQLPQRLNVHDRGQPFEEPLDCHDGSRRWVVWHTKLLDDYEGAPAVLAVGQDITDRRHAEEALRKEKAFAESLIETAPAIVLVLDPQGRIVRFNAYMEELSGYRLTEVQGKDWFSTFLPMSVRTRIQSVFEQALHDSYTGAVVHPILTRDGRQRQIKWANKTLVDAEGRPSLVLSIGHDVTDLQAAQEKSLQAERLAAIGEMMTGLTHESRNALQRSKACLEMLELEVAELPSALDLVGRLSKAQEHLQRLYEEVRSYAAPIRLNREPCDIRQLWQEIWSHLAPLHTTKQVDLQEQVSGIEDFQCLADRFALGQVFRNILENAVAVVPNPGRIAISAVETTILGKAALEVVFADNGPGLDADQRQRIFEPFFTTKTKGTGLGMAIAKRIVESHGGQISVRDRPPPGAEIVIALPRGTYE